MDKNETQKNQINEADYIDITVFIRAFLRLARRYVLLVCPMIICLTAIIGLLSRALVKEQYVAEASFVVGVTRMDDFSYDYTLPEVRSDYVVQMSEAFQSALNSDYMYYLLEEELGTSIPGTIGWGNAYGTNFGGINVVSDSLENAVLIRDGVITCLPKVLFTTFGEIELKVLDTSERIEVSHERFSSPLIWVVIGVIGGIFAYLGIIFLLSLWRHDIETPEDMEKITNLLCLGSLPKSGNNISKKQLKSSGSGNESDEYNKSFLEFRKKLAEVVEQQQVKTILFTGGYKKRGQNGILDKLTQDWNSKGRKAVRIDLNLSKASAGMALFQNELKQKIEDASKESDLIIINGPDYDQTVELLNAADCADGIVYILKSGFEQMEKTEEAIHTLEFSQAKLLGYVITV